MKKMLFRAFGLSAFLMLSGGIGARAQNALLETNDAAPVAAVNYSIKSNFFFGIQVGTGMRIETFDAGDDWKIRNTVNFENGIITDTVFIDKKTLLLKKGISREFDKTVEYQIKDGKAFGVIAKGKKSKPFSVDVGADVSGSRTYLFVLYALLPIDRDYAATVKIFDPGEKQIETLNVRVVGEEAVAVSAGTFDCYKVRFEQISGREKNVEVWLDKNTRRLIKMNAAIGMLKGFKVSAELDEPARKINL